MKEPNDQRAPEFSLQNQNQKTTTLSDLRGTWVVCYFYPKDLTSGCTLEAIDFTNLRANFKAKGATIIGISPDSPESHAKFCTKHELTIDLLSDPNHAISELYNVWKRKKLYGREYDGVARTTLLIDPAGVIRYRWENVKVKDHAQEVYKKLLELL